MTESQRGATNAEELRELTLRAREGDLESAYAVLAEQVPVDTWVAVLAALTRRAADVDLELVAHRTLRRTRRLPDFTITRSGQTPVYWEHLGMLESAGYRADWEKKRKWFESHEILPLEDGGGSAGVLVCSVESQKHGIDSAAIESLAKQVSSL